MRPHKTRIAGSTGSPSLDRRTVLKSAAGLIATGVLVRSAHGLESEKRNPATNQTARASGEQAGTSLLKRTMGFMLAHEQFQVPELVEQGVMAEKAGFDLLATSDHFQPWQSNEGHSGQAWVTLAATGQKTNRVWMGTAVTCPTFRYNPAVVAEAFASLSRLSPGRIFLGLGSGEALNEEAATGVWPNWAERSGRLVEATQLIRQLWTGEPVAHKGKYYTVNARLYDSPAKQIPILMAANGPKAMHRAGQYGDGLITDPLTWKERKSEFEAGAKAAGKDPSQMPVLVEQFVAVGDQGDAKTSAELWRFLPKAFKTYYNVRDPQQIQRQAETEIPLESIVKDWPVSTEPEAHLKIIRELFNSGATIVNIHSGQADQKRVLEFYGKDVLPKLRQS